MRTLTTFATDISIRGKVGEPSAQAWPHYNEVMADTDGGPERVMRRKAPRELMSDTLPRQRCDRETNPGMVDSTPARPLAGESETAA